MGIPTVDRNIIYKQIRWRWVGACSGLIATGYIRLFTYAHNTSILYIYIHTRIYITYVYIYMYIYICIYIYVYIYICDVYNSLQGRVKTKHLTEYFWTFWNHPTHCLVFSCRQWQKEQFRVSCPWHQAWEISWNLEIFEAFLKQPQSEAMVQLWIPIWRWW